jgi:hypothetical protein
VKSSEKFLVRPFSGRAGAAPKVSWTEEEGLSALGPQNAQQRYVLFTMDPFGGRVSGQARGSRGGRKRDDSAVAAAAPSLPSEQQQEQQRPLAPPRPTQTSRAVAPPPTKRGAFAGNKSLFDDGEDTHKHTSLKNRIRSIKRLLAKPVSPRQKENVVRVLFVAFSARVMGAQVHANEGIIGD